MKLRTYSVLNNVYENGNVLVQESYIYSNIKTGCRSKLFKTLTSVSEGMPLE